MDDQVDLVLNHHDGSGFYRPKYYDGLHNKLRWGQSIIIDQNQISSPKYQNLLKIATGIADKVNRSLLNSV